MKIIGKEDMEKALNYAALIPHLKAAFCEDYTVPERHHHHYQSSETGAESTLLLMPAWRSGKYLGVKMVTVSPENGQYDLPAIQGTYSLFDTKNGIPVANLDAKILTAKRTAAASALASSFLSRKNSNSLLMIGTGALAAELIPAHATVRPLEKVWIWGRNKSKAEQLAQQFSGSNFSVEVIDNPEEVANEASIISCATLSSTPLVLGKWITKGQHIDLVGAYRPDMRESDDEVILKSTVFVDSRENAPKEAGDLIQPIQQGKLKLDDIKADLFELCKGEKEGRTNDNEIICFKSVGHALEDLAAAELVMKKLGNG
jgi:ornithine cyclodeaminase/alanine dehydrogenase-like protein (mu-crystallin family)